MRFRSVLFGVVVCVTSGGFFACGSRSALPGDIEAIDTNGDDTGTDARARRDTGVDSAPPPLDAKPPVDANRNDCPDADATLVYVITSSNQLLSFFPSDGSFKLIGNIACPTSVAGDKPFSMAVDRKGVAYVEFDTSNDIFKVSTLTAACTATAFVPHSLNYQSFGMGFATLGAGPAERLYIAGDDNGGGNPDLGYIDVTDMQASDIAPFGGGIYRAELTGTGDGRLFAFWTDQTGTRTNISQVDPNNGDVIGNDIVPGITVGQGWAFGFWGGKFYTFTSSDGSTSQVTQFDPVTKAAAAVAFYPSLIVGAGVSTCAPQQ